MIAKQRWHEGTIMPRFVFNASSGTCFVQEFETHYLPDLEGTVKLTRGVTGLGHR